jgi:hypothetical protein
VADNVVVDNGALTDFQVSADEAASGLLQRVKLAYSADGADTHIPADANGLLVYLGVTNNKIKITDGTSDATVRNLASNDALNVAIVDGAGNQVTSFGGTGGTSATDDADFTRGTTPGTPIMGVYETAPGSITDGDMGIAAVDQNGRFKVSVDASTIDVAHDAVDSGNPVKVGARAINALPTPVANNDRANNVSDLWGRQLISHIDPAMQIWKSANYTSLQTGAVVWDPAAGKKIAITHLQITSYGTVAGRIILFFNTTTTYTEGTHQPVFKGKHSPSSSSTPGALPPVTYPLFSATADAELRCTTDAGISLDIVVYGYEF